MPPKPYEDTAGLKNWNQNVIDEFKANQGKVGGPFQGASMLLLTTTGAKSGKKYTTPLVYMADGSRYLIFASYAGAPQNPAWYNNIVAHPRVTLEVGTETFDAQATVLQGAERDRLFQQQAERAPQFAEYQKNTDRVIPVVALERIR
ncbi:MAG TPA: nitroreductase family deazaflavin-dependent oxidoreductase [Candidatus Xenobia bacterium]|jgi:deazaflavin-dependent oxidoreductase (nitroreductase family)